MNDWFQFKQFIIYQDKCAMKVCTDACILGAWVAEKIAAKTITANLVLDIGCGTGLLSLMLAQEQPGKIDAVDINEQAFLQACNNVALSPFCHKIFVHHAAINTFAVAKKYDLVICNPPFYENDLKAATEDANTAMHSTNLTLKALAAIIKNLLADNGKAAVMLPYSRAQEFKNLLTAEEMFANEELCIAHSPSHKNFRIIFLISKTLMAPETTRLYIRDETNGYTEDFKKLLHNYYLHL